VCESSWAPNALGEGNFEMKYQTSRSCTKGQNSKVQKLCGKISTGFAEDLQSQKAMQADDGEEASRVTTKLTDSGFEISELRSVCRGVDTTGLAASLPTLPVGLSCHGRSSPDVIKAKLELRHNTGRERVLIVLPST